ncbi:DUF5050 domain-containing protein [Candidatus Contubernalis alkalaceticus]|nr:DUF5050 domain-containing protein [Candidatus Contubernalis alkalaceticus]UNC91127.1 DUF5050 domain-containing protein [Candidatus Contubernalis alkalaceticus]
MRTDGTDMIVLRRNVDPEKFVIAENWIYYLAYDANNEYNSLYKMKTDGKKKFPLSSGLNIQF